MDSATDMINNGLNNKRNPWEGLNMETKTLKDLALIVSVTALVSLGTVRAMAACFVSAETVRTVLTK